MSRVVERRWSATRQMTATARGLCFQLPVQEPLPLRGSFACRGWALPAAAAGWAFVELVAAHKKRPHTQRGAFLCRARTQEQTEGLRGAAAAAVTWPSVAARQLHQGAVHSVPQYMSPPLPFRC